MNRLTSSMESMDRLSVQMTSACEFANQACHTSNPTQLLTSQNQIMERLSELENKKVPVISPEMTEQLTELTLTDQHHSAMTKIQESVQSLFYSDWEKKSEKQKHTQGKHFNIFYCMGLCIEHSYNCTWICTENKTERHSPGSNTFQGRSGYTRSKYWD